MIRDDSTLVRVYVSAQQRERFWTLQPADMTNGEMLLTAVEQNQQQLQEHFTPATQRLFTATGFRRTAISVDRNDPRVAYSAQISQANLAVIDQLCGDLGVSRSAYLAAALEMQVAAMSAQSEPAKEG